MAFRPVNLTELVRSDPPVPVRADTQCFAGRALVLWNATMGGAQYLTQFHNYYAFRDSMGTIWVQSKLAAHIMPPPGGVVLDITGEELPYQAWLVRMRKKVRKQGKHPLDPDLPYRVAVIRLYSEYYKNHPFGEIGVRTSRRGVSSGPLKALNPYIAHRSKFNYGGVRIHSTTDDMWPSLDF